METHSLQAFLAVADQGSFSRAAETLFITQPAISKRIAALEQQLDARLFDRVGRRIALTEAGHALAPHARRVMSELRQGRQAIASLGGDIRGRLTIGTSHHIGLHRLPPVLREFTAAYPDVELDLHFMDSEVACEAVERGELELALVTLPDIPSEHLRCRVIWPDPLAIITAHGHPLTDSNEVTIEQLACHPAVLPGTATFTRRILDAALRPHRVVIRANLESNYLETIKMLVSVGLGWGVLPLTMANDDVRPIPVPQLTLHRDLGLVRHRQLTPTSASAAFTAGLGETEG